MSKEKVWNQPSSLRICLVIFLLIALEIKQLLVIIIYHLTILSRINLVQHYDNYQYSHYNFIFQSKLTCWNYYTTWQLTAKLFSLWTIMKRSLWLVWHIGCLWLVCKTARGKPVINSHFQIYNKRRLIMVILLVSTFFSQSILIKNKITRSFIMFIDLLINIDK